MATPLADEAPERSWALFREQLAGSSRSPEARAAGEWALATLERELGCWPDAWGDGGPAEIECVATHLVGLGSTIALALALDLVRDERGAGRVRAALTTTGRADQFAAPRMQLQLAALAAQQGLQVELEPPGGSGRHAPADLCIGSGASALKIEMVALLRGTSLVDADRWLGSISAELTLIALQDDVQLVGRIGAALDDRDTETLLDGISAAASRGPTSTRPVIVRVGDVEVAVYPGAGMAGAQRFQLPADDGLRRLASRLRKKADQCRRSGANWLVVAVLNDLWRLTPWSALPLAEKTAAMGGLVRHMLTGAEIDGVLLTDGAATLRTEGERAHLSFADGLAAHRERLDAIRVRESIVVPLRSGTQSGLLGELLEAESEWLAKSLAHRQVLLPPELAHARGGA